MARSAAHVISEILGEEAAVEDAVKSIMGVKGACAAIFRRWKLAVAAVIAVRNVPVILNVIAAMLWNVLAVIVRRLVFAICAPRLEMTIFVSFAVVGYRISMPLISMLTLDVWKINVV